MSIRAMAGRMITVYRRTALVVELQPAVTPMSVDRALQNESVLEVTATTAVDAQIVVNGSLNGVPKTENLQFLGSVAPSVARTIGLFDEVTFFTLDPNFVGNAIQVRTIGQDGTVLNQLYVLKSGVRAHLNHGMSNWKNSTSGTAETQQVWFGIDYSPDWTPREGDVFLDANEGSEWLVVGTPEYLGQLRPHHWEVRAKRRQGSL